MPGFVLGAPSYGMLEMKLRPLTRPVSWTERAMSHWLTPVVGRFQNEAKVVAVPQNPQGLNQSVRTRTSAMRWPSHSELRRCARRELTFRFTSKAVKRFVRAEENSSL